MIMRSMNSLPLNILSHNRAALYLMMIITTLLMMLLMMINIIIYHILRNKNYHHTYITYRQETWFLESTLDYVCLQLHF